MEDIQTIVTQKTIQNQIFTIRGKQVMLDRDLAVLFDLETRSLNQAVKRNLDRFPENFMFQLSDIEFANLKSQTVISSWGGIRKSPYVFTEMGIAMLSAILRTETAVRVSIQIMDAFVEMRRFLKDNAGVFQRIFSIERRQTKLESETDQKFEMVFDTLQRSDFKTKQGIFYDGQIFDAYTFIADIIRQAKKSIVLIDDYVDDTVLRLFTKRDKNVSFKIYTKTISSQLSLDLQKHNAQYTQVIIKTFNHAHDRFLIVDEETVYLNSHFTVIIGSNGSGKSTLLEAVQIAASAFFIGLPYVKQRHITDDKNIILEATGYINDSGTFSWRRESLSQGTRISEKLSNITQN